MRDINIKKNQSLERISLILDCFSINSQFQTIDAISDLTKLPKATVYRLLYSMERHGLVYYHEVDGMYGLGIKMLDYGGIVLERFKIRDIASRFLTSLHHHTGCRVLLGVLEGDRLIYVDKMEGLQKIGYTARIGGIRDPHRGVLGKTLMAFLDDHKIADLLNKFPLKKYTDKSIIDANLFMTRLHKIKSFGYGIDIDETIMGQSGVAVPIRNKWNQVVAAVTAIGPTEELRPFSRIFEPVRQCAFQISEELGATIREQIVFRENELM